VGVGGCVWGSVEGVTNECVEHIAEPAGGLLFKDTGGAQAGAVLHTPDHGEKGM